MKLNKMRKNVDEKEDKDVDVDEKYEEYEDVEEGEDKDVKADEDEDEHED